jgi:glucosamine 6-phosphate synthetase-like amidotransferase/phosphosugar isomerase protein
MKLFTFFLSHQSMIDLALYDRNGEAAIARREMTSEKLMPVFDHEMLREIYEQPLALRHTIESLSCRWGAEAGRSRRCWPAGRFPRAKF